VQALAAQAQEIPAVQAPAPAARVRAIPGKGAAKAVAADAGVTIVLTTAPEAEVAAQTTPPATPAEAGAPMMQ
jgi:hypothetical protein